MNKIHNIIWSTAQNAWVVVAEGTKAASKAGGAGLRVMIALIMLSPVAGQAASLPQGGTVTVGQGTIVSNGSNQMIIKQTTDKLGINWQSFNVGADGHVVFDQPGKHSVALNRVIGSDGSAILGKIDANGQVFLINPNGVIFGKDAKVNVGGLIASTLEISDADFATGNYKLAAVDGRAGEIVNNGSLQAAEGGYIALLGKSVKNNGVIRAQLGTAAMAAGEAMTLDFSGDGLINVQVTKSAVKALVDNQGLIQADGGSVLMTARATNALMDTVVNNDGVVQAQTIKSKSGKIFLDGGSANGTGTVTVGGILDASAPASGDGGVVETSGKNVVVKEAANITTYAIAGKTGVYLIDPIDFEVTDGTAPGTLSSIGNKTLEAILATSNVELQALASGDQGDLVVNGSVTWNSDNSLTLTAGNQIIVNKEINVNGVNGRIILNDKITNVKQADGGGYQNFDYQAWVGLKMGKEGKINLNGSNSSYNENGVEFTVIRGLDGLRDLQNTPESAMYVIANDIDAADTRTWNSGSGYQSNGMTEFGGVLNGLGHSISNLYGTDGYLVSGSLFGNLVGATVQSLKLANVDIHGYSSLAYQSSSSYIRDVGISGSIVADNYSQGGGLFSELWYGTLSGITVNADVSAGLSAGGIANLIASSHLNDIDVSGNIVSGYNAGLISGYFQDSSIQDVTASGTITGTGSESSTGGLFGGMYDSSADRLQVSANIISNSRSGGIAGEAYGFKITDALFEGSIDTTGGFVTKADHDDYYETFGNTFTGGIVGFGYDGGVIERAASLANISSWSEAGGIAGYLQNSSIKDSFSQGSVKSTLSSAGGLVGAFEGSSISNSYSTASVSGFVAGGLVGMSMSSSITNAYASGHVDQLPSDFDTEGKVVTGGLVGWDYKVPDDAYGNTDYFLGLNYSNYNQSHFSAMLGSHGDSVITSSFWNKDTTGQLTSDGGVGKTDLEMKSAATFGGWSLSASGSDNTTWRVYEGHTGPLLRFAMTKADVAGGDSISKTYDGSTLSEADLPSYSLTADPTTSGFWNDVAQGQDELSLKGGFGTGYGQTLRNAGVYTAGDYYSSQFGYDLNQTASQTVTINKAVLDISADAQNKAYDGTTAATVTLTDNRVIGDNLTVSGSSAFTDKNAGVGKAVSVSHIIVSGVDAGNYTWNESTVAAADIAKANLVLDLMDGTKSYDGSVYGKGRANYTFFDGDDVTPEVMLQYSDKNVSNALTAIVVGITATGADAGNYAYSVNRSTVDAVINPRLLSVSAVGNDKVYDGSSSATADLELVESVLSGYDLTGMTGLVAGDVVGVTGLASFADKNAGSGKVVTVSDLQLTGIDASNYMLFPFGGTTVQTSANIAKANLLVSAMGGSKIYDGSIAASGITLTDNRVLGDNLTIAPTSSAFTDKNAGAGKVINTGIAVSGSDASNYNWSSSVSSVADIAKANLVISAVASDKVYDGSTQALTTLGDNRIAGDDLALTSSGSNFADRNAGAGKAVVVSGISVTGADAQNYAWNAAASSSATITKASLVVGAIGQNKVYDGSAAAGVTLTDNRISGDDLSISKDSALFSDKNAGSNKVITVGGINVTGADAVNYSWNASALASASIAKAALVIAAVGQDKSYDGTSSAVVSLSDNRIGSDMLNISAASSAFSDRNAGASKAVSVTGISVTGSDAGNYLWNASALTSANIEKAGLTVIADQVSKVAGAADGPLGWSLSTGTLYGSDSIDGALSRAAGEDAGTYAIGKGTLSAGSNYSLSVIPGSFVITAAPVTPVIPVIPVTPVTPPPVSPVTPVIPVVPVVPEATVQLNQAKDIISSITVAAKPTATKAEPVVVNNSQQVNLLGDYRLLNLGIKLPEEFGGDDSTKL
jgi:filamentous hemagglutinin family protein